MNNNTNNIYPIIVSSPESLLELMNFVSKTHKIHNFKVKSLSQVLLALQTNPINPIKIIKMTITIFTTQ